MFRLALISLASVISSPASSGEVRARRLLSTLKMKCGDMRCLTFISLSCISCMSSCSLRFLAKVYP